MNNNYLDLVSETVETFKRRLEDAGENTTEVEAINDSQILRDTMRTYGLMFLVFMLLFCWLRVKYPRTYNVRSWIEDLQCSLAEKHYGYIDWAWKLWYVNEDEFRDCCGMDALSFIRIMLFGLRIAFVGMFNSLWLMPTYGTAKYHEETADITDPIAMVSIAHVPSGSSRLLATVFGTYIVFGFIFYSIIKEFEWFTEHRHKYLMRKSPSNYTIYVSHIPPELRSSAKLLDFFRRSFSPDAVLEAHCSLKIPALESAAGGRDGLVNKLEHAINVEEITGKTPTHREILKGNRQVNSIESWTQQLREANEEVKERIEKLETMHDPRSYKNDLEASIARSMKGQSIDATESMSLTGNAAKSLNDVPEHSEVVPETEGKEGGVLGSLVKVGGGALGNVAGKAGGLATSAVGAVLGAEDGEPREAGFVTFTKLSSTQAALQMIHHPTPHKMKVQEAPEVDDIFWLNVGKSNYSLQVGSLISLVLTTLLCLFWTIPMTFIQTLTEVEKLQELLPFLEGWIENAPWLGAALNQLAPLMLIIVNNLLPYILEFISTFEGPVSNSVLQTAVFTKLSAFMIIQTFFVSAISGSLISELQKMIDDPALIIDLLATSLPGQSTFFVQLLMVQTFLGLGLELLKVTPLAIAAVRTLIGPKLTEKERNTTFLGLRPLADPKEFEYSQLLSGAILYFMVQFVYSTTAPSTNWFMALCFAIMIPGYKHQFIYNYPTSPDSGGKIWTNFIQICIPCMMIAELALLGLLALKKSVLAVPFMVPLLIFTYLFSVYIRQEHYHVTAFLPSRECLIQDLKNREGGEMDYEFLKGQYLQPAMKIKLPVYPENMGVAREVAQQEVKYLTPPSSEAEIIDDEEYYYASNTTNPPMGDPLDGGDVSTLGGSVTGGGSNVGGSMMA